MTALLLALIGCGGSTPAPEAPAEPAPTAEAPSVDTSKYEGVFQVLPEHFHGDTSAEEATIALGRMLYYDKRLSENGVQSCNTCHQLDNFGQDSLAVSPGARGGDGVRNSPTVLNAAGHFVQFWDGREPHVEAQAKGPILNPDEMAMPNAEAVVAVLKGIPGYVDAFKAAFPNDADPVNYDNVGNAIGAFERGLATPGPFDRFLAGDSSALTAEQVAGLDAFMAAGCTACHSGALLGGSTFQKLGLVLPYETGDLGRMQATNNEADKHIFKVPSLRNVSKTAPYFHDGSIADLPQAVKLMASHQLGKDLSDEQVGEIVVFLDSLTMDETEAYKNYVKEPALP